MRLWCYKMWKNIPLWHLVWLGSFLKKGEKVIVFFRLIATASTNVYVKVIHIQFVGMIYRLPYWSVCLSPAFHVCKSCFRWDKRIKPLLVRCWQPASFLLDTILPSLTDQQLHTYFPETKPPRCWSCGQFYGHQLNLSWETFLYYYFGMRLVR